MKQVADGWKPGTTGYRDVLDLVEPAHTKDSPLAAHVKGLQTIEVDLVDRPGLSGAKQYENN